MKPKLSETLAKDRHFLKKAFRQPEKFGGLENIQQKYMPTQETYVARNDARSSAIMAAGTLVSRILGFVKTMVGSSLYWEDWSKDIATVADRYIHLIDRLLEDPQRQDAFQEFVGALRATLNPAVDNESAVEMLAQHILTAPLFDAKSL